MADLTGRSRAGAAAFGYRVVDLQQPVSEGPSQLSIKEDAAVGIFLEQRRQPALVHFENRGRPDADRRQRMAVASDQARPSENLAEAGDAKHLRSLIPETEPDFTLHENVKEVGRIISMVDEFGCPKSVPRTGSHDCLQDVWIQARKNIRLSQTHGPALFDVLGDNNPWILYYVGLPDVNSE